MTDIPDDIRATAAEVFEAMITPGDEGAQGADFQRDLRLIAEALMAERERCATIADEIDQPGIPGTGEWLAMGNFAGAIRDAIRSQPDTSKGTA